MTRPPEKNEIFYHKLAGFGILLVQLEVGGSNRNGLGLFGFGTSVHAYALFSSSTIFLKLLLHWFCSGVLVHISFVEATFYFHAHAWQCCDVVREFSNSLWLFTLHFGVELTIWEDVGRIITSDNLLSFLVHQNCFKEFHLCFFHCLSRHVQCFHLFDSLNFHRDLVRGSSFLLVCRLFMVGVWELSPNMGSPTSTRDRGWSCLPYLWFSWWVCVSCVVALPSSVGGLVKLAACLVAFG